MSEQHIHPRTHKNIPRAQIIYESSELFIHFCYLLWLSICFDIQLGMLRTHVPLFAIELFCVCNCEKKRKRECHCDCGMLVCSHTVSTHCSSHNCRTLLLPAPPPSSFPSDATDSADMGPLTYCMPAVRCHPHTSPSTPLYLSPIAFAPPPGIPTKHPVQEVDSKDPSMLPARPVIRRYKDSFQ